MILFLYCRELSVINEVRKTQRVQEVHVWPPHWPGNTRMEITINWTVSASKALSTQTHIQRAILNKHFHF